MQTPLPVMAIIALILFASTSIVAPCMAQHQAAKDPRCAEHTCAAPLDVDYSELGFENTDPTACSGKECPKCLVGPEWDARRASLGFGNATRNVTYSLNFGDWLSTEMSGTVFRILAEEMMNYELDPLPLWAETMDVLCCQERDLIYLEAWPAGNDPDDDGYFTLSQLSMGYEGGVRLWVTQDTVEKYPLSTAYSAYKYLPDYANILQKAGSTPCEDGVDDTDTGCVEGNYKCDYQEWNTSVCQNQGRYVPPQCEGENFKYCQEILSMWPTNEPGFFEALIRNTGLNFTIFYVGYANLVARVQQLQSEGKHAMFYGWEPDPMIPLLNAKPVVFPTPTAECKARQTQYPSTSGGDCDFEQIPLKKVARRASLAKDPDFKRFFDAFTISGTDMFNMLKRHTSGGGDLPLYNVSCEWIKNNYAQWEPWIKHTPDPVDNQTATRVIISQGEDKEIGPEVIVPAVVAPIVAISILVGVFLLIRRRQIEAAIKHAPRKTPLTLIFTDVESSTSLWEQFGTDMASAMEMHHAIIRELIEEHQCYEVKTIGDSFMIACPTLIDATMLSLAIQRRLHAAEWPKKLVHWKQTATEMEEGPQDQWSGLRVRIGIHYCLECDPQYDMVHGRYDYYGHDVNVSARVESMAQGGQILMTADTHAKLVNDPDFQEAIGDDAYLAKFASGVELKGVSEAVVMYSCTPTNLNLRRFNPIGNGPAIPAQTSGGDTSDSIATDAETLSTYSVHGGQEFTQGLRIVFNALPSSDRNKFLLKVMAARKINTDTAGTSYSRRMKTLINNIHSEVYAKSVAGFDERSRRNSQTSNVVEVSSMVSTGSRHSGPHQINNATPDGNAPQGAATTPGEETEEQYGPSLPGQPTA